MIKSTCALLFFSFLTLITKAQNTGGGVDDEKIHFGFTFQYVGAEYKIYKKENWGAAYAAEGREVTPPLYSISSESTAGFGLGFVSDFRLGTHGNLRFTPVLVFSDRILEYTYNDKRDPITKKVLATLVDFPLGFKLKSDKRGNFRAYMLGGLKYSRDIISKKKTDDTDKIEIDKLIKNRRSFFSYEAGIGFDLYFDYFKLSPEIKLSHSINSVLDNTAKPNAFNTPIDKLFLRNFIFSLYFE